MLQDKLMRQLTQKKAFKWLLLGLLLLNILSLSLGAYDIQNQSDGWWMFWLARLPRTLAVNLSGWALAISGLVMQLLTRNRFAEPTTTGTFEWAGLGILLALLVQPNMSLLNRMLWAMGFAALGQLCFFVFLRFLPRRQNLLVPLVGLMLGTLIQALATFIALTTQRQQAMASWFVGSFAHIEAGRYEFLWLLVPASLAILLLANQLTIASLGEFMSQNLGLNYQRIMLIGLGLVALITGIIATVVGRLPFIGLLIPNMVRLYLGDDAKTSVPWVGLLGAVLLLAADCLSRLLIIPFEMPVAFILSALGALAFLLLILHQQRGRNHA